MEISYQAKEIVRLKPRFLEFQLLAQVLTDEITVKESFIKKAIENANEVPESFFIHSAETLGNYNNWLCARLKELENLVPVYATLIAENNEIAFGPPGQAGDADKIIDVAMKATQFYMDAVNFVHKVRLHRFEIDTSEFGKLINRYNSSALIAVRDNLISEGSNAIKFYENVGPEISRRISQVMKLAEDGVPVHLDLSFEFSIKIDCSRELNKATLAMKQFSDDIESVQKV